MSDRLVDERERESGVEKFGKGRLRGQKVAILATDGFEQSEFFDPREALEKEGATTFVVSLKEGRIRGWNHSEWGRSAHVDYTVDEVSSAQFDGLMLPGGVMNPDRLRMQPSAVEFVKGFVAEGKPIAAICHGPWLLIETGFVKGKTVTSWPSLKTDLTNAGAIWVDREVVVDDGLVTSRMPDDLVAFNEKMVEEFAEGLHGVGRVRGLTREDLRAREDRRQQKNA